MRSEGKKRNKKAVIKAIDFFCGAGGVTRGLLNAGIDVICGIDNDPQAKRTFEENNIRPCGNSVEFIEKDINKLEFAELRWRLRTENYDKLLFVACAPCQPFTNMNTIKKNRKREKNYLLRFAEFVEFFKPYYVFVENVPGVTAKKYGGVFDRFKRKLSRLGYNMVDKNINAKYYGVPQNRNRRILIASKGVPPDFPKETHGKGKRECVSIRKVLKARKLKHLGAGESDPSDHLHRAANLSPENIWRIKHTKKDGGGREVWMRMKPVKCFQKHKDSYKDVYNRMFWDKPSPTITTRFNSLSNGRFGHPEEDRAISLREGALFQTFSYNYKFYGSMVVIAKHIGNAVPVRVARIFGRLFLRHASNNGE